MTPLAITFVINSAASFLKNYVFPKFGKTGVHVILFVLALFGAMYLQYLQNIASIHMLVVQAVAFFAGAIALYEVLLSYFPFYKGTTGVDNEG